MGGCCSSPAGSGHKISSKVGIVSGPATHDSAWSVSEHQANGVQGGSTGKAAASGKQQAKKQQQQQQQQSGGRQIKKKKKVQHVDLATGELIPDFGVHGVFDVLYELGSGGSGTTYLCRDMASGKVVAVKFVPRPLAKAAIPFLMAEVELQAELGEGSLTLISVYELVLTKSHLALVLEYASGGSLTQEVTCLWESALQRGGLFMLEQEASYYLRQFIHAIAFCHQHKVAHRDLKLDNTLLEHSQGGPSRLKICDFGFAKRWTTSNAHMQEAIGTPVYMSPQMLAARQCASGYSGIKADMWAAGILMFVMLLGTFPFDHDAHNDPNSSEAANEVWLKQQQQGWRRNARAADVLARGVLSPECCDLLDKLLEMNEEKRASSAEVLTHPWLSTPLSPEQQAAWDRLRAEQAALEAQLQAARDPRLGKMRREAMFAMMALAAKPPSRTLFPSPSSLQTAGSAAHSTRSTASSAATSDGMPRADSAGSSIGAAAAASSPAAAAVAGTSGEPPGEQHDSVYSTAASSDAAAEASVEPAAAPTAAWPPMVSTAAAAAPAGGTPELAAAAAAAPAGSNDDDLAGFRDDLDESVVSSRDESRHLSFIEGEGIRSEMLELKVEAYRQQCAQIRVARVAAAMAAVKEDAGSHQQQLGEAAAAAASADSSGRDAAARRSVGSNSNGSDGGGIGTAPAAATAAAAVAAPAKQKKRSLLARTATGKTSSTSNTSSKPRTSGKSPFAAVAGIAAGSGSAAAAAGPVAAAKQTPEDSEEEGDAPDEVWRLPLSSTADPSVFKLTPELAVAAGALIRQLQGTGGKVPGRGRASRSSCPMY